MNALTSETLRRAADLSDEIAQKQNELNQLLAGQLSVEGTATPVTAQPKTASNRKFSPEAIEKIRAAQRRRWRKERREKAAAAKATEAAIVAPPAPAPADVPPPVAPVVPVPRQAKRDKTELVAA